MWWTEFRLKKHMPGLQKFELFTICFHEFPIPNPDFRPFFFTSKHSKLPIILLIGLNISWKFRIQNWKFRENIWWAYLVVHQKSCEHRLFQLLSKHYFKRFKTRLLLHPSSVAQNHSPYWWCHIPKRKKLWKENFSLSTRTFSRTFWAIFFFLQTTAWKFRQNVMVKRIFFCWKSLVFLKY